MSDGKAERMFRILANRNRLNILFALGKRSKNVTQLGKELGLGQTLVSHNLKKLVTQGFVNVKKDGHFRIYSLNKKFAGPFLGLVAKAYEKKKRRPPAR